MAVLWRDGEVIPLPPLVANEPRSEADINNRDEIVGQSRFPPVSNLSGTQKAVLWVPQAPPHRPRARATSWLRRTKRRQHHRRWTWGHSAGRTACPRDSTI